MLRTRSAVRCLKELRFEPNPPSYRPIKTPGRTPWRGCDEAAEDPFPLRRPDYPRHLLAGDPRPDRRGAGLDLRPLSPRKRKRGRPDGRLDLAIHMALKPVADTGRGQQAIARPQQERLVAPGFLGAPLRPV